LAMGVSESSLLSRRQRIVVVGVWHNGTRDSCWMRVAIGVVVIAEMLRLATPSSCDTIVVVFCQREITETSPMGDCS
jgi:hypothetical protein